MIKSFCSTFYEFSLPAERETGHAFHRLTDSLVFKQRCRLKQSRWWKEGDGLNLWPLWASCCTQTDFQSDNLTARCSLLVTVLKMWLVGVKCLWWSCWDEKISSVMSVLWIGLFSTFKALKHFRWHFVMLFGSWCCKSFQCCYKIIE